MSTPSKKRRKAREWMTRTTEEHKKVVRLRMDQASSEARDRANRDWREKLTRIVPPNEEGIVYPQGRIEKPYIYVLAPTEVFDYASPISPANMYECMENRAQAVRFEAKQMAHVLPNGAKVVWWTWEIQR